MPRRTSPQNPSNTPAARFLRPIVLLLACIAAGALTGCSGFGLGSGGFGGGAAGSGAVVSDLAGTRLPLELPQRAAVIEDHNTADVYLTDLSPTTIERIAREGLSPEISGTLAHVHIFLNPKPGRTPIEETAASATIRLVVIARGQIGVYDGAGFLMPGRSLRKGSARGTLRNAATRLSRSTPGFEDLLGSSRTELGFGARSDPDTAARLAGVIRTLVLAAEPVGDAEPADD